MGDSASAYFFFGAPFTLPETEDGETEEMDEWEEKLAAARGAIKPVKEYTTDDPDYLTYWRAKRAILEAEYCAIDYACTYDESFPFVFLKSSMTRAEMGPPVPVTSLAITPDDVIKLVKFCQLLKIDAGDFGWHLAAFYG